ncbi:hypothetical protein [Arthrobacter sp. AFG20]|uniref:hypothetical protein n=1 Tax=Arthrobacter sp. AFG20 TaxID=1688671 RepID=UPI000C9E8D9C|nr:hypothetical protein [Arthrobacter sp. AFG20]PNH83726.1 hypothetical protein CXZ05_11240 [Arthrobacter sp. AFG20]
MSGQQHTPVPETTPLPPAPQPDKYSYQPGPGAGRDAGSGAGPARAAEPDTEPVTSLGTFSSGSAASNAAPPAAVPDSAAPAADLNSQTTNYQAPHAGWGGPTLAGKAGGPGGGGKPWTMKRGLVVAGAATVLAAGAGATVYGLGSNAAAAGGTAAGAQGGLAQGGTQGGLSQGGLPQDGGSMGGPGLQSPGSGTAPGQGGDFAPNGLGGMGSGVSAAVHSEYVVEENGKYVTKVAQLGTVSAVSSGSVTVKSADGFTRTYTLSDDTVVSNMLQRRQQSATGDRTVADIVTGAAVRIVAGKDGSAFPAESVQVSGTSAQSGGGTGSGGSTQSGGTSGTGQSS